MPSESPSLSVGSRRWALWACPLVLLLLACGVGAIRAFISGRGGADAVVAPSGPPSPGSLGHDTPAGGPSLALESGRGAGACQAAAFAVPECAGESVCDLRVELAGPRSGASTVMLVLRCGTEEFPVGPLPFNDGVAHGVIPRRTAYWVKRLLLDSIESDQEFGELPLPPAEGLTLVARVLGGATVEVIAKQTDLRVSESWAQECVLEAAHGLVRVPSETPDMHAVVADNDGRLRLVASARPRVWIVGAAGFATTIVRTDPARFNYKVSLLSAGTLDVLCVGAPAAELVVIVRPVPGPSLGDPALFELRPLGNSGVFRADGLRPGRWRVMVGRRHDLSLGCTLASQEIEVTRGWPVRIEVSCIGDCESGTLEGVVLQHEAWRESPTHVVIGRVKCEAAQEICIAQMERSTSPPSFRIENLPTGSYDVTVYPCGWTSRVLVEGGSQMVAISVGAPVEVRVDLRSKRDHKFITAASVVLNCRQDLGEHVGQPGGGGKALEVSIDATFDETRQVFVAQVPPSIVTVEAWGPGFVAAARDAVATGGHVLHLEHFLSHAGTIHVTIVKNGRVDVGSSGSVSVRLEDGVAPSRELHVELAEGRGVIEGLAAGRYVLEWQSPGAVARRSLVTVCEGEIVDACLGECER